MKIKPETKNGNAEISARVLAKNVLVNNDTRLTRLNNNDIIVGPSGAGKTRGYITPNILHSDESMIVADTKGSLFPRYGDYLRARGYKVQCIDFKDIERTPCGYNPLDYIRKTSNKKLIEQGNKYNEQDVKKIALNICPVQSEKDPFWDRAAQMYLEAFIMYVLKNYPKKKRSLTAVYEMLCDMETRDFDRVMDEEIKRFPDSTFAKKYRVIGQNAVAEKMHASIKGILAQHLDVISYSSTEYMFTMDEQLDMNSFLEGKTALFLNISDSDRSQDALVNIFYTQALQFLMLAADSCPESRLPIPVRFLLDDFSTNTVIPDFDNIISVIRSRGISVSLIVQSLSQLRSLYGKDKANTIINNCDHCLYLGGTDVDTASYFSEKFNCPVSTVLNLPLDAAFLFERGSAPRKVEKYDLDADAVYAELLGER
ncbi:MAG: type IV secretory system conjugative DNA transfer family protein [Lachnospiraceae bacterium]|nr:type IV secretory system conjugative DNA transfer family protein [Ruminococcus sp.]MCM1276733.1 type IV secretory system conjugative DNA transfer family protein [Lachnospiraceae bacterium]